MLLATLWKPPAPPQMAALAASVARGLASGPRGICTSQPAAVVEKGPFQTDSSEGAKHPFVEEQGLAGKRAIRDSYEDVLKDKSGTAEDVSLKDKAQSTLGRMMTNPQDVETEYAKKGRDSVASHGGRERESEDEAVADAVFDQARSDKGYDEAAKEGQPWHSTYARKPQ